MKGIPTFRPKRLKQAVVMTGAVALVAAASVLGGTGVAHAAGVVPVSDLGNGQGTLTMNPTSGATTSTPTWNSPACPGTNNGSAKLLVVDPVQPTASTALLAPINNSVTSAFSFTSPAADELANVLPNLFDDVSGDTVEVVVECYANSGGLGASVFENDTFLSISSDESTFTQVPPPAAAATNVTVALTASPNPATSGQAVTLTATVTPATATGTIQFENNGTDINAAAPISGGMASTSTSFSGITTATNEALTAVYNPTGNFAATTPGSLSLPVNPAPPNSGTIPLAVNVPQSGTFTLTVDSTDWVVLGVNAAGNTATAATTPIVVTDTRNYYPGWSVTGQATAWHGVTNPASETPSGYPAATNIPADHGSQSIAADQLGWAPTNTGTLPQGVGLGSTVAAGTNPGLGDAAQVLASVHAGTGNGFTGTTGLTLGANLTLAIPAGQEAGPYAADLNIDAADSLP